MTAERLKPEGRTWSLGGFYQSLELSAREKGGGGGEREGGRVGESRGGGFTADISLVPHQGLV